MFGHCRIVRPRAPGLPSGRPLRQRRQRLPNDISGWNTERNNNDPQTEDPGLQPCPGPDLDLVGEANNNFGARRRLPRAAWSCRSSRAPRPSGAATSGPRRSCTPSTPAPSAISSVVVEYTYSSFAREAVDYANRQGVLLSFDSNDFDSTDHTDGMLYNHVIPGNSLTEDAERAERRSGSARVSNVTSYGTAQHLLRRGQQHLGGATPFLAGMMAMVQSAGAERARRTGSSPAS